MRGWSAPGSFASLLLSQLEVGRRRSAIYCPSTLWVPHGGDELATVVSSRH